MFYKNPQQIYKLQITDIFLNRNSKLAKTSYMIPLPEFPPVELIRQAIQDIIQYQLLRYHIPCVIYYNVYITW